MSLGGVVDTVGAMRCCSALPDLGQELSHGDVRYEIM